MIGKASIEPSITTNQPLPIIKNINNNNKSSTTTLDLNITRRPLSPVHNLNPEKPIIKIGNIQSTSTKSTTNNYSVITINNKSNNKSNPVQIKPISLNPTHTITFTPKLPTQPSPRTDSENFDNINEEELPILGDVSNSDSTQSCTKSQEITPIPEVNPLINRRE